MDDAIYRVVIEDYQRRILLDISGKRETIIEAAVSVCLDNTTYWANDQITQLPFTLRTTKITRGDK